MLATVVIAHYNENIDWVNSIDRNKFNIEIYSKTLKEYNYIDQNRGNEASSYLQYIIDNYENLPEHNFFVHGHNNSYHQDITNDDFLNKVKLPSRYSYFNINRRDYYIKSLKQEYSIQYMHLKTYWPLNEIEVPDDLSFYSCAQFYVHRDFIYSHSRGLYKKMFDWLMTTDLDNKLRVPQNYYSTRLFEYMWHVIFTGKCIEPIHSYDDLII